MRDDPDAVMLFAAGFGTRMRELTRARPKPMVEVAGRPLIDHALALTESVTRRVANTHYLPETLERHLNARGVTVSREAPDILDTGGGLRHARPLLGDGPVFTLNTDAVWSGPSPLDTLRNGWRPEMEALLLLVPVARAEGRDTGDFDIDPDGRLTRGGSYVYTGAQILRTNRLADVPERAFSLNVIWNAMARDGGLFGAVHPGGWCDVGSPEGIVRAEEFIKEANHVHAE
ncbi:nucleotidyltransferase family protein [Tranquillimonas alkanivorans]|uniref:MobA-like NTP transferase domain-containing protein n=1 Tax=Tranquillimonas alkanivorans TaxID=441119 RepID=A0A1I5LLV7_9RHOB|nr:nucleotidyltransferase family protein [Tranquillimonas alkanivorans]SFO98153.1 MobA-like NTP transferase domain-containing protein [Tranquillimonas alkanivorans]